MIERIKAAILRRIGVTKPRANPDKPAPQINQIACVVANDSSAAADRLLVFADAYGATQHISFTAPLETLRAAGAASLHIVAEHVIDGMTAQAFQAAFDSMLDTIKPTAIVLSRAGTRHIPEIVRQAHTRSIRLIAHLDDDLFAVPAELGAGKANRHNDPARLARLMIACRRAKLIYASTPKLGEVLQARFDDRPIIAGDIYATAKPPFAPFAPSGDLVFGYMGTSGHAADLEAIAPAIAAALAAFPKARFETFGTIKPPASLEPFAERVRAVTKTADYPSFLELLKTLRWRAGLAPLLPTPFNACKADTKFIEYAQAGIPAILAANDVYRHPLDAGAALGAANNEEWRTHIFTLLNDHAAAQTLNARAQDLLAARYSPDSLQAQLLRVVRGG